jgi:hypothetical protein
MNYNVTMQIQLPNTKIQTLYYVKENAFSVLIGKIIYPDYSPTITIDKITI